MVLPLLSQDGEIGDATVDLVKTFLRIDCDCLWRALLSLSGCDFPARPVLPHVARKPHQHQVLDTMMAGRAKLLMDFVEELPEQPLV